MFNVEEGGVSTPISWSKDALQPDRSIIIMDESSQSLFLWHGVGQGLVARRTALRQAESLKGHGFTIGKTIVGRDLKNLKEIDARKVGRDPETDKINNELQELLNRKFKEAENLIVTFDASAASIKASVSKPKPSAEPTAKPEPKVGPKKEPHAPIKLEAPVVKPTVKSKGLDNLKTQAKVGFMLVAITEKYKDIWISKKDDGSFAVEMMDGPICQFSIENSNVKFSVKSFKGISPDIKNKIQNKFNELNKLV